MAQVLAPNALNKNAHRNRKEQAIAVFLIVMTSISVLTTIGVILALTTEASLFFADDSVTFREFFTAREWSPLFAPAQRRFGVAPLFLGTLLVSTIALVVGMPLGLGAAIYLSEFASKGVRRIIMPILEILAGVPTIVLGYFALLTITPSIRALVTWLFETASRLAEGNILQFWLSNVLVFVGRLIDVAPSNALSAGLVMGFMLLPTVSSVSIDAMQAVPRSLREAAFGLGATKGEVTQRVVVPAALSGIVASFILAMSRAVGETMIVTLAAGQQPNFTFDPRSTIQTMTSFIAGTAQGDQPAGTIGSLSLYAVGTTLFVTTLLLNIISQQVVRRFSEKYE